MHTATRTRRPARPAHARRVSGPIRPVTVPAPAAGAVRRGTTGVFERIRALPETRLIDGLLRGRAWIWLIGVLLGGIVAMQVTLLKLNTGISRAVTTTGTLERQNADLEADIARLSSGERVRATAAREGMITPPAGEVAYLHAGDRDAARAARRMTPPSDEAAAVMANGGREPGVLAAPPVTDPAVTTPPATTTADPSATAATDPATTVTTDPETTATPDPAATPTPDPAAAAIAPGQG